MQELEIDTLDLNGTSRHQIIFAPNYIGLCERRAFGEGASDEALQDPNGATQVIMLYGVDAGCERA